LLSSVERKLMRQRRFVSAVATGNFLGGLSAENAKGRVRGINDALEIVRTQRARLLKAVRP
jgi:hypothetical protein